MKLFEYLDRKSKRNQTLQLIEILKNESEDLKSLCTYTNDKRLQEHVMGKAHKLDEKIETLYEIFNNQINN